MLEPLVPQLVAPELRKKTDTVGPSQLQKLVADTNRLSPRSNDGKDARARFERYSRIFGAYADNTSSRTRCALCGMTAQFIAGNPFGCFGLHPINNDHEDVSPANLKPVCPICHDFLEIGFGHDHQRGEVLVSTLCSQVELVNTVRALFVAILNDGEYTDRAHDLYDEIRNAMWQTTTAALTSEYDGQPSTFGTLMQRQGFHDRVDAPEQRLANVRYLPHLDGYMESAMLWRDNDFKALPESEWGLGISTP